jgi:zinc transport system substrate-binding protein
MVLKIRAARILPVALVALVVMTVGRPAVAGAATKRSVVASFYPIAWAVEQVGGDRVEVDDLTPAGAEPHDLELTPRTIDEVLDADVVFELGHGFQPAVEDAAAQRDGPTVTLLPRGTKDPHVWLDPVRMVTIVRTVERALAKADPMGRTAYVRNAQRVVGELEDLDARYRAGLADCQRTVVVTAHEAFGHLAKRYGLRQEGVAGLSPDAEPDARRIGELAALVRRLGVTTVFTEELLAPRLADALAREAGVGTDTLNPLEGLTDQELRRGDDYLSVMGHNLGKLEQALGCR